MNGRPTRSEAAAYYFAYIDQVAGVDVQAILAKQMGESSALTERYLK